MLLQMEETKLYKAYSFTRSTKEEIRITEALVLKLLASLMLPSRFKHWMMQMNQSDGFCKFLIKLLASSM